MNIFDAKLRSALFKGQSASDGVFIELRGNRRLIAEGIDALLEYGESCIAVGAKEQRIAIEGNGLEMRFLSENRIVIEGDIRKVCYLDENE